MEKITTDIYSFENLRKGGYVYIAVKRSCVLRRLDKGHNRAGVLNHGKHGNRVRGHRSG